MASLALKIGAEVLNVLPFIEGVVKDVEALFGNSTGAQKKQAALAMAGDGLNIFASMKGVPSTSSMITADIDAAIEAVVKLYNDLGVFTHAKPISL